MEQVKAMPAAAAASTCRPAGVATFATYSLQSPRARDRYKSNYTLGTGKKLSLPVPCHIHTTTDDLFLSSQSTTPLPENT